MRKTVAFYGTVSARSGLTLVSDRIGHPYTVRRLMVTFAEGQQNLVLLRFFVSIDDAAPTTERPGGTNLLQEQGQVDYLVGDGVHKTLNHTLRVDEGNTWLKVYAVNDDFYDHAVDVQLEIDIGEPEPD